MSGIMSSPYFSNCVQNSAFQVVSEGSLKAVGRPLFTLADKNASPAAKKYSAMKEFTFQAMSMLLYAVAVTNIVKKGGYKMLTKLPVFKDMNVCKTYKTFGEFNNAFSKVNSNIVSSKSPMSADIMKKYREFALVKGAMEQIVMIGSGVILTVLCPLLVSKLVHPVMNTFDKIVNKNNEVSKNTQLNNIA